jgi:hypothetical protein
LYDQRQSPPYLEGPAGGHPTCTDRAFKAIKSHQLPNFCGNDQVN